jgi:hypothetical protein
MKIEPFRRRTVAAVATLLLNASCEAPRSAPAPASLPASAPAKTVEPPTSAPAGAQAATLPTIQTPRYVRDVERIEPGRPARVAEVSADDGILKLSTQNVSRMRIERTKLPFDTTRSVVLRIDRESIEWLPGRDSIELELAPTGDWRAAPRKSP